MAVRIADGRKLDGGRYTKVADLGSGGFGSAFLGVDRYDDKFCFKVISLAHLARTLGAPSTTEEDAEKAARREAQNMRDLTHERIVRVFDYFTESLPVEGVAAESPCFVLKMQFLPNGSLEERLHRRTVSVDQALHWSLDVAEGLALAHSRLPKVFHCDLKPSNVCLDTHDRAVIIDWSGPGTFSSMLTHSVAAPIGGTTWYLSPERRRHGTLSWQEDIWAWGLIALQLLLQRTPFELYRGDCVGTAVEEIAPFLEEARSRHLVLGRLITQALKEERRDRPTAASIVESLVGAGVRSTSVGHSRAEISARASDDVDPPSASSPSASGGGAREVTGELEAARAELRALKQERIRAFESARGVDDLAAFLGDSDAFVRSSAADVLWKLVTKQERPRSDVRRHLQAISNAEAASLRERIDKEVEAERALRVKLGAIRDAETRVDVSVLVRHIADSEPDRDVRKAASNALLTLWRSRAQSPEALLFALSTLRVMSAEAISIRDQLVPAARALESADNRRLLEEVEARRPLSGTQVVMNVCCALDSLAKFSQPRPSSSDLFLSAARIREAFLAVDRGDFVRDRADAYEDCPQRIGFGATISAPHMYAAMFQLLDDKLVAGARVLDVGSGSGFSTVFMARLVGATGRVIGIDHIPELVAWSEENARKHFSHLLSAGCLVLRAGDGYAGSPDDAPFDVIYVGAAAPEVPPALLAQLRDGGRLIIPVGPAGGSQELIAIDRRGSRYERRVLMGVRFVPLTDRATQLRDR